MNAWSTTWLAAGALALGVLVLLVLVGLAVALARSRSQTRAAIEEARLAQAELARRLEQLERPAGATVDALAEFVITDVGEQQPARRTHLGPADAEGPTRIDGRLFVDIVARETVVKAASWTYGVRRALSPENRNRLRFEMRRQTKAVSKQRKADVKEALRQYYAKQERSGRDPRRTDANGQEDVA